MPKDNNQQPITPTTNSGDDQFPVFVEETLPPMPQGAPTTPDVPPAPEKKDLTPTETPIVTSGSAAPQDDAIMPPTVTSKNKKKFAGGKVIATILGLFLLVGGVGAGVLLVSQDQNISEKAYSAECNNVVCNSTGCTVGSMKSPTCYVNHYTCNWIGGGIQCGDNLLESKVGSATFSKQCGVEQIDLFCNECGFIYEQGTLNCTQNPTLCQKSSSTGHTYVCTNEPSTPPTDNITASCSNIKVYTESWVLIDEDDLPNLSAEDSIKFCVNGVTSSGSFDMAKITVNGTSLGETSETRPGTSDFCSTYVIPPATTIFNVTSQIHHTGEGWK